MLSMTLGAALLVHSATALAQTCPYDTRCIDNPYGAGSPYNPDSVNNPYGQYGSPYSNKSANNHMPRTLQNSMTAMATTAAD